MTLARLDYKLKKAIEALAPEKESLVPALSVSLEAHMAQIHAGLAQRALDEYEDQLSSHLDYDSGECFERAFITYIYDKTGCGDAELNSIDGQIAKVEKELLKYATPQSKAKKSMLLGGLLSFSLVESIALSIPYFLNLDHPSAYGLGLFAGTLGGIMAGAASGLFCKDYVVKKCEEKNSLLEMQMGHLGDSRGQLLQKRKALDETFAKGDIYALAKEIGGIDYTDVTKKMMGGPK